MQVRKDEHASHHPLWRELVADRHQENEVRKYGHKVGVLAKIRKQHLPNPLPQRLVQVKRQEGSG